MRGQWIAATLVAGLTLTLAGSLSAQQRGPAQPSIIDEEQDQAPAQQPAKPSRGSRLQTVAPPAQPDPNLNAEDQLAPSQMSQPVPAAVPTPSGGRARRAAVAAPGAVAPKPSAAAMRAVACSGPFAKDSNNLALATAFDSKNVTFTEVDVSGSKV